MQPKSLLFLLSVVFLVSSITYSQEKWNKDPRMTSVYPSGNYVPLPQYKDNLIEPDHAVYTYKSPMGGFLPNLNFRVHPDNNATQSEVILVRNSQLPNLFFGSANVIWPPGGFSGISEGVYVSTNGGLNWFGWDTVHSPVITGHGGDPGPAIDKNGTFIISHLGYPTNGMFANYSTDMGATWSATYTIASGSQDKNFSGSDDIPASPYYGRSYTVWSLFNVGLPPIASSYTTNGGVSWSSYVQVNTPPSGHYSQGVDIKVGPVGIVYLTWGAPIAGSPYTEDFDGFAKSTNGGSNWTVTENAFDANGIRGYLSSKGNIRVNSFPRIEVDKTGGPRNGWIYVVGCDKNLAPAGSDPDIILHRSTDGGTTWSSGIRVNQDALNNGAIQYFGAIVVDDLGGVNIVYYDDRNMIGTAQCGVYVSRSTDGGSTWTDVQVSDHSFTPAPIPGTGGGYQGDYIGINYANNKIWPFWCDNSSGIYQTWTTWVDISLSPVHDIQVGPFMHLPSSFVVNNTYDIMTQIKNNGTSNETNVPIKWFINGNLINTTNKNLNAGQVDSVTNPWTPASAGSYTLMYVSALANDTNRTNDTVKTTVNVTAPIPDLCEGFSDTTFPPAQWTSSGAFWLRNANVSGFGLGRGAAYYNCWNAVSGENEDLTTMSFPQTQNATDSLVFDHAYSPYPTNPPYSQDSLIILASTNNGSSWIRLLGMGPVELQTAPSGRDHFIPAAGQWAVKRIALPVGTNKIDFFGKSGYGNDLYIDSVCIKRFNGINSQSSQIPKIYSLSQNYPNPFNPSTMIKFSIPKASRVKLVVYDLLGKEVLTLVNEQKMPGNYEAAFNGSGLASGVYFYKLEAGAFTDVKKMVLIK